jgi:hypothetical protein
MVSDPPLHGGCIMNIRQSHSRTGSQARLVKRSSDGVIEACGPEGRLLAHFNPHTNESRNHRGDLIGKGNRLASVLQAVDEQPTRLRLGGK